MTADAIASHPRRRREAERLTTHIGRSAPEQLALVIVVAP